MVTRRPPASHWTHGFQGLVVSDGPSSGPTEAGKRGTPWPGLRFWITHKGMHRGRSINKGKQGQLGTACRCQRLPTDSRFLLGIHKHRITGLREEVFLPRGRTDPNAHSSLLANPSQQKWILLLVLVGGGECPTLQEGPSLSFQISGGLAVSHPQPADDADGNLCTSLLPEAAGGSGMGESMATFSRGQR